MLKRNFLVGIILSSALVDFLGNVRAGPLSANGVFTVLLTVGIGYLLLQRGKLAWEGFVRIWPLSILLLYSVLQGLWHRPSVQGFQNICVLWIFLGCIVLSSMEGRNELEDKHVVRLLLIASAVAAVAYGLTMVYNGLGTEVLIGARSWALYALLGLGLLLGRWARGSRLDFWLALGLTLLVALSLSRTALAVAALLFPLARIRSLTFREISRMVIIGSIAACGLYYSVVTIPALRARFLGDNTLAEYLAGEATVQGSGRFEAWALTFNSYLDSPWLGNGPGTADDLNGDVEADRRLSNQWELAHPLNEYLRFLHDEGLLGLVLLMIGLAQLLLVCRRAFRQSIKVLPSATSFCLGTYLVFVAVLLTMITDNPTDYVFMMGPFGILLGTTLRTSKRLARNPVIGRVSLSQTVRVAPPTSFSPGSAI